MHHRFIFLCLAILLNLAGQAQNPSATDYVGEWSGEKITLNFRKKTGFLKYEFETIQVNAKLKIQENYLVTGVVGTAAFKNVQAKVNKGDPKKTGVVYIIPCGNQPFVCNGKTYSIEQFEIWLLPIQEKGKLSVEFRSRESFDLYPIGGATLTFNK